MGLVTIYETDEDARDVRRLMDYFKHVEEEMNRGKIRGMRREKINPSYVYRLVFRAYWLDNEQQVKDFEKEREGDFERRYR